MGYKVKYKTSVKNDFSKIPSDHQRLIKKRIDGWLKTNPYEGRALKGRFKGLYRIRVSSYRVIYQVIEKEVIVLVLRVGHRKDVYRGILR